MIDDDIQRQIPCSSARVPGNRYRQISIVDPPASRGKENTSVASKEIEPIDFPFYFFRASELCVYHSFSPLYILFAFIYMLPLKFAT